MRRVGLLMFIAVTAAVLWASAPVPTAAADGEWSVPYAVSGLDPRAGGWFPSMTTDVYGQVHLVWNGRAPRRPAATSVEASQRASDAAGWLVYSVWDGRRWSSPNEIAAIGDEGDALRSSLAADPSGHLHLLYRGLDLQNPVVGGAENEPIRYSPLNPVQGSRTGVRLSGTAISTHTPSYFSDIVADRRGVLHVLMTQPGDDKQYAPYYRRSEDGGRTWTPAVAIEQVAAISRWRLQLKIGQDDVLHAVWEVVDPEDPSSRVPVGFVYARSTDHGQTWSTVTFAPEKRAYVFPKLYDGTRWRVQPAVGVDGRGQAVLVWREFETNLIYFQRSTDGRTWTPPSRVGGVARGVARPFDRYDMATDSAGRLHLVMVAYPDGAPTMSLLHSEWTGYGWGDPEVIMRASVAPFPEWPRIAISEGNRLHVAWFGGSAASVDRVPVGIWHSTRQTSAPSIPVAPVPAAPEREAPAARPPAQPVEPAAPRATPTALPVRDQPPLAPVEGLQPPAVPIAAGVVAGVAVLALFMIVRRLEHGR